MTTEPKKAEQRNTKFRGITFSTLCGVQGAWTAFSLPFLPKNHFPLAIAAVLSGMCLYLPTSFQGKGVVKGVEGFVKKPWYNKVEKHSTLPDTNLQHGSHLSPSVSHVIAHGEIYAIFNLQCKSWGSCLTV